MSRASTCGLKAAAIGTVVVLALLAARAGNARRTPPMAPQGAAPSEGQETDPNGLLAKAPRHLLSAVTVIGASVAIAVAGAGASYALWTSTVPLNGGTVSAGSTSLTVNGVQDYTVPAGATVGPQNPVFAPILLANTGTAPVIVTATTTAYTQTGALADNLTLTLGPLANGETCGAGLVAPAAAPLVGFSTQLGTIPAGASAHVCLGLALAAAAPATVQGGTASFTITIDAGQVPRS
ncbi:hypothetical protein [Parafrigoribacterium mesophilum]|uniref:hypothetical protein n=1 Tax=Parafrigoribacterium mesophilum TaxID=433646 RepID=UPI0031FBB72B